MPGVAGALDRFMTNPRASSADLRLGAKRPRRRRWCCALVVQALFRVWKHLDAPAQAFGEGRRADRHDHEFLKSIGLSACTPPLTMFIIGTGSSRPKCRRRSDRAVSRERWRRPWRPPATRRGSRWRRAAPCSACGGARSYSSIWAWCSRPCPDGVEEFRFDRGHGLLPALAEDSASCRRRAARPPRGRRSKQARGHRGACARDPSSASHPRLPRSGLPRLSRISRPMMSVMGHGTSPADGAGSNRVAMPCHAPHCQGRVRPMPKNRASLADRCRSPLRPTRRSSTACQSAPGHGLRRALHRAGVHHAVPDHGAAGFRASRHRYVPGKWLVESKSLSCTRSASRNHGAFHEDCTVAIGKRLVELLKPKWLRSALLVSARRHADSTILAAGALAEAVWVRTRASRPIEGAVGGAGPRQKVRGPRSRSGAMAAEHIASVAGAPS